MNDPNKRVKWSSYKFWASKRFLDPKVFRIANFFEPVDYKETNWRYSRTDQGKGSRKIGSTEMGDYGFRGSLKRRWRENEEVDLTGGAWDQYTRVTSISR